MNRFFDSLTPDQLTDVEDPPGFEKVAKASWGGQSSDAAVADSPSGSFDSFDPDCTSSDHDMDVNSALNDEDFSDDVGHQEILDAAERADSPEQKALGIRLFNAKLLHQNGKHKLAGEHINAAAAWYVRAHS
jgi:hypothetical protein